MDGLALGAGGLNGFTAGKQKSARFPLAKLDHWFHCLAALTGAYMGKTFAMGRARIAAFAQNSAGAGLELPGLLGTGQTGISRSGKEKCRNDNC